MLRQEPGQPGLTDDGEGLGNWFGEIEAFPSFDAVALLLQRSRHLGDGTGDGPVDWSLREGWNEEYAERACVPMARGRVPVRTRR